MWIKICGTTNLDDAQLAVNAGADAVGFVFAKKSKRYVSVDTVAGIVAKLPTSVEKVGVFTTDDPFEIEHAVTCCGLTAVQLHSPFDAEMVELLSGECGGELKIIQVIAFERDAENSVAAERQFAAELTAALAEPAVWAILIDTSHAGNSGGTGLSFDWKNVARLLTANWPASCRAHLIVAGGLSPENVTSAIATLQPWGVDVVSGVEMSPGQKDGDRVRSFIRSARGIQS